MSTQTQVRKKGANQDASNTQSEAVSPASGETKSSAEIVAKTNDVLDQIDKILAEVEEEIRQHAEAKQTDEVKPFTLADAIRLGSEVTNQAVGAWSTQSGEVCALAAAYLAVQSMGLSD